MTKIQGFKHSVTGKRSTNQDDCILYTHNNEITLLAVADGMGGHKGGETASQIAIETTISTLINLFDKGERDLKKVLSSIYSNSDKAINEHAESNPDYIGMGTTLSCVLIHKDMYAWANIGDSRIYHFSQGEFRQITKDHTYLQDYIDQFGNNVPDNISAQSHFLTRALNGSGDQPDIFPSNDEYMVLQKGEAFLLCSDGLIPQKDFNYNSLFANYLTFYPGPEDAAIELVNHAYNNGSNDNITLIIAEYGAINRNIKNKIQLKTKLKETKKTFPVEYNESNKINRRRKKALKVFLSFIFIVFVALSALWLKDNTGIFHWGKSFFSQLFQKSESIEDHNQFKISWSNYKTEEPYDTEFIVIISSKETQKEAYRDTTKSFEKFLEFSDFQSISEEEFNDKYELRVIKKSLYQLNNDSIKLEEVLVSE